MGLRHGTLHRNTLRTAAADIRTIMSDRLERDGEWLIANRQRIE